MPTSQSLRPEELGVDLEALAPWLERVGPLAVVDLETTGLAADPEAEPIEVGALLLAPGAPRIEALETLLRPSGPLPAAIRRLTGLDPSALAGAPRLEEVASELCRHLGGRTLVAHNAAFERHFLARHLDPRFAEARYLDTQDLLALTHPDAPDLRLESFVRLLLGGRERHRALSDALDTLRILSCVAASARAGEARYAIARRSLEAYLPDSPWLALLAPAEAAASFAEPPPFVEVGASREKPVPFDEEAIALALSDAARGRRHFRDYRVREGQIRLARHFVRRLREGGRSLVEGGTGVGKSLAYLAAAIPFVCDPRLGPERGPVLVSTRTKLLQDQLIEHDIPAAARFLGYPGLRALSIKGRANYACARRLARVLAEGREPALFAEERAAYAALAVCAFLRPRGEIGSVPAAWLRRYPRLAELLRRSVSARSEQCTREQCRRQPGCPLRRQRSALAQAQLVVANHDLLLRWPADYPAFRHAIVDEAHELAEVADEVYAQVVSPPELIEALELVFGLGDGETLLPPQARRRLRRDAQAWRREIQQGLIELGKALLPLAGEFGQVQVPPRPSERFALPRAHAETLAGRLEAIASSAEAAATAEGPLALGLERALGELRAAARTLRVALGEVDEEEAVASFEGVQPSGENWRLVVRAVSPAEPFHRALLDRLESFVGVSASLFVDGDAFAALGELDLEGSREPPTERLSEPSPFPYATQMRVVALDDPGDPIETTADAIERLALRLEGRTLGLFTSLRRMAQVADRLAERLRPRGLEVLTPRRAADDPAALVERFRAGGAVLLGARKFWQGLDLRGDALEALVIEKLPFEVPTELRRRRELRLRRLGLDAFERYTMGKMLLNLKQMVGRLIRSETDRGLVVIVDARRGRRYFERLDEALPPGCSVRVAALHELDALLEEVGIGAGREPASSSPPQPGGRSRGA